MTKCEILAELKRMVPTRADYGQVNQYKLDHAENKQFLKLIDVLTEDMPVSSLLDNIRLGLEEW